MLPLLFIAIFLASLPSECFTYDDLATVPTQNDQNSVSGVNFIFFLDSKPSIYQKKAVQEISGNIIDELERRQNMNLVLNRLFPSKTQGQIQHEHGDNNQNIRNPQIVNKLRLVRRRRSPEPTYKKGYRNSGGGGGCCSSCGQCGGGCGGGGCGGGGSSGSYSQSQSYSSSSSGSYSSGKK